MEFAKSHLEWMSESVARSFDRTRDNAFNAHHLKLVHSMEEFDAMEPGPKVVLATMSSLEARGV